MILSKCTVTRTSHNEHGNSPQRNHSVRRSSFNSKDIPNRILHMGKRHAFSLSNGVKVFGFKN